MPVWPVRVAAVAVAPTDRSVRSRIAGAGKAVNGRYTSRRNRVAERCLLQPVTRPDDVHFDPSRRTGHGTGKALLDFGIISEQVPTFMP